MKKTSAKLNRSLLAFLMCAAVLAFVGSAFAQTATDGDYRSAATGNWSDTTKWQVRSAGNWVAASVAPTSANNVYIQAGHTITVNSATVACNDLHACNTGVLAIGANTLQVNGKIRAYTQAAGAVTTLGADSTFYSGQVSSTSPANGSITSTLATGKLQIVGSARTVFNTGEFASGGMTAVWFDVNASGVTILAATAASFAKWTFTAGTFDTGGNAINCLSGAVGG